MAVIIGIHCHDGKSLCEIAKLRLHQHAHLAQQDGAGARHGTPDGRPWIHGVKIAQQIPQVSVNLGMADEVGVHWADAKNAPPSVELTAAHDG